MVIPIPYSGSDYHLGYNMKTLFQRQASWLDGIKLFFKKDLDEAWQYNRLEKVLNSDKPLEAGLLDYEGKEISYEGYNRVLVPRTWESFTPSLEHEFLTVQFRNPIDFPEVRKIDRCPCCGHNDSLIVTGFAFYLDNYEIIKGSVNPRIVLAPGIIPRITANSTVTI